ncbi:2-aminoadipate transaminase OS=Castellaniella defragrans OX=75697 GN=HNR28_000211 PE=4 SV=1 [Castellaniella defragrans]
MQLHEVPLDASGWDLSSIADTVRQVRPDFAYLIPDFQNPTGAVMTEAQRARLGAHLRAYGTIAIVDETHHALALDGQRMPPPFAAFSPDTFTLGSMSKAFWGGLRVGWVRAPHPFVERLTRARMSLDLGVPVVEQLVSAHLLRQGPVSSGHVQRLRAQRDALLDAVAEYLPDWRFSSPSGGLSLWCELPQRAATALAAAVAQNRVFISPGPVFSPGGGLDSFVRLPWTRPVAELQEAVARIAAAWRSIEEHGRSAARGGASSRRVVVA